MGYDRDDSFPFDFLSQMDFHFVGGSGVTDILGTSKVTDTAWVQVSIYIIWFCSNNQFGKNIRI